MTEDFKGRIGKLIRDARTHRGLTQQQLAERLQTSQSAVNRIEKGHQNLSLEMVARIGTALDSEIVALGAGPTHLRITGPTTLSDPTRPPGSCSRRQLRASRCPSATKDRASPRAAWRRPNARDGSESPRRSVAGLQTLAARPG